MHTQIKQTLADLLLSTSLFGLTNKKGGLSERILELLLKRCSNEKFEFYSIYRPSGCIPIAVEGSVIITLDHKDPMVKTDIADTETEKNFLSLFMGVWTNNYRNIIVNTYHNPQEWGLDTSHKYWSMPTVD